MARARTKPHGPIVLSARELPLFIHDKYAVGPERCIVVEYTALRPFPRYIEQKTDTH